MTRTADAIRIMAKSLLEDDVIVIAAGHNRHVHHVESTTEALPHHLDEEGLATQIFYRGEGDSSEPGLIVHPETLFDVLCLEVVGAPIATSDVEAQLKVED